MRTEIHSLLKEKSKLENLNVKGLETLYCYTQKYLQEPDLDEEEQLMLDQLQIDIECQLIFRDELLKADEREDIWEPEDFERMFIAFDGL